MGTARRAYIMRETHANRHAVLAVRHSSPSRPVLVGHWGGHHPSLSDHQQRLCDSHL
jgi:hypothetical protein